jgi:adenine-specific DNA-methyltransferase
MTELIWDGKYKDGKKQGPVRIALPFQTVETVNESAQDRRRNLELFASGRDTEWRDRLIWGDKKYVLPSLLPEFAGKVNLIYIDPPFGTGADFSLMASIPESDDFFEKQPSIIEQKAYRDTWGGGVDSYVRWFYEAAVCLRDLLCEDGSLYVHLDFNVGHYVKVALDEIFGVNSFRNEIVWRRTSAHANVSQRYGNVHDVLLYYTKSEKFTWNQQFAPYDEEYIATFFDQVDEKGRKYARRDLTAGMDRASKGQIYTWRGITPPPSRCWSMTKDKMDALDAAGKIHWPQKSGGMPRLKLYPEELPGTPLQDLWANIPQLHNLAAERLGYPTQKPEALLERVIKTSSNESDLVLDCFVGSGTTAAVAEKLNRRWIACDLSRFAIHTTRKRLLGIPKVKPFAVQNLGKYERQAWQAAEFPANGKNRIEEQCRREAAYRRFLLDLYHGKPITGYPWLHGTKGGRMVHVAAVDAPVTQSDVKAIARDAWKAIGSGKDAPTKAGVDILGWEFALELNETAKQAAAESRVDVSFKKIPREVLDKKAVEQGDVKFFELGALSLDLKQKVRAVTLKLSDFVIPTDDIPEEARKAIKHWSQLVDYWAVDWDFKGDTFHNQWQAYRTRKEPKIELATSYEYREPRKYQVVVKVIDILGNDTTKTLEVTVK